MSGNIIPYPFCGGAPPQRLPPPFPIPGTCRGGAPHLPPLRGRVAGNSPSAHLRCRCDLASGLGLRFVTAHLPGPHAAKNRLTIPQEVPRRGAPPLTPAGASGRVPRTPADARMKKAFGLCQRLFNCVGLTGLKTVTDSGRRIKLRHSSSAYVRSNREQPARHPEEALWTARGRVHRILPARISRYKNLPM